MKCKIEIAIIINNRTNQITENKPFLKYLYTQRLQQIRV